MKGMPNDSVFCEESNSAAALVFESSVGINFVIKNQKQELKKRYAKGMVAINFMSAGPLTPMPLTKVSLKTLKTIARSMKELK